MIESAIQNSLSAHNQMVNYGLARGWFGDNVARGQISGMVNNILDALSGSRDYNNAWSAYQAQIQRDWSAEQAELTRRYNTVEAAKNRDWQEMMSNTAHQREVRDLQAAGLNPVLSAMGGNGAAVTSGASASASVPSGSTGGTDESMNAAIASILGTILNNQQRMTETMINSQLTERMTEKQLAMNKFLGELSALTSKNVASINAAASTYGAKMSYNSSKYVSDNNLTNSREQREWDAEHPNNPYAWIADILNDPESFDDKVMNIFDDMTGLSSEDHEYHYDKQHLAGQEFNHRYWYDAAGVKHEEWQADNGKWYGYNPITG